jgi:hypothetical protein
MTSFTSETTSGIHYAEHISPRQSVLSHRSGTSLGQEGLFLPSPDTWISAVKHLFLNWSDWLIYISPLATSCHEYQNNTSFVSLEQEQRVEDNRRHWCLYVGCYLGKRSRSYVTHTQTWFLSQSCLSWAPEVRLLGQWTSYLPHSTQLCLCTNRASHLVLVGP